MRLTIMVAAGWLLAAASQAQSLGNTPGNSRSYTLGQALEQAWLRHPQAGAFGALESQAQARAEVASGITPAPSSLSLSNVNDRFNADAGKDAWELEWAMPLWLPGQRAAHGREADSFAAEVAARRAALRLQLAGELRTAWWTLGAARQGLELSTHKEAAVRALEADVARRLEAGELARMDANLAVGERMAAQAERMEALQVLRLAEQNYRLLTGVDAPVSLPEESPAPFAVAGHQHPQLLAAQAAEGAAQARLQVVQRTRRDAPELALRLERERGDVHTPYANAIGFKLTIPLSSEARTGQETFAAQAQVSQATAELQWVRQRIEREATAARQALEMAQQQLELALQRQALMADTVQLAEKSYALGESDLGTLLRARGNAQQAQALVNRQRMALLAGVSHLNQSLGVLP